MKIEIKNRYTNSILISGEYDTIKECLVDNSGADLWGADLSEADLSEADLSGADLWRANLRGADLSEANLRGANLSEANLSEADLSEADLWRANLRGANLSGADLWRANLSEANLWRANLWSIKNYSENHQIWQQLIKLQSVKIFTDMEWSMIGKITLHMPCWDTIKNKFGVPFLRVLEVLKEEGFTEYYDKYAEILGGTPDAKE